MADKTQERIDGPTPNGGAYSIAYFQNEGGEPITKDLASKVEILEFDQNGSVIHRTYGLIHQETDQSRK